MPKSNKPKLKVIKAVDGKWWITKLGPGWDDQGPYDTKNEALEEVPGLERFLYKCKLEKKSEN